MEIHKVDTRGLLQALLGDGRPFLIFGGLCLVLSGCFALFLSATGHFLPHDVQFLGMTAERLCGIDNCRIVYFMFHDRVAFGGALVAIGSLYMWMAEFPLRHREAWAWWLFIVSGVSGFGSFLAYLGYGYLDTWHGIATLLLVPFFFIGLLRSRSFLDKPTGISSLFKSGGRARWSSAFCVGRSLLLATAADMIAGGFTVMIFGMTLCASGLEVHGYHDCLPARDQSALGAFDCARPSRLWWRDLYGWNHSSFLRLVRSPIEKPMAGALPCGHSGIRSRYRRAPPSRL